MHWLLHLLVDAVLVATLAAAYCAYQEHRRRQSEYARVQLYEDADKPFCGGTPEVGGGWADPDDRDEEELTSIAVGPSHQTPPGAHAPRGGGGASGGGAAASKKSGKSGKKSGNKTKRSRADADLQEALSPYDVQALISKELEDI